MSEGKAVLDKKAVRSEIEDFIAKMEEKYDLFPYCANEKTGGFQPGVDTVYYSGPYWDMNEKAALVEAMLVGRWLSSGEYVNRFERLFSKMFGFTNTVMVNSGSSANLVMISSLKKHFGWADDDEIVLSPVGFPTTLAPIIQNRLKPVFVDIDLKDLNFDADLIEAKLTNRTRAIMIAPVLGNPPDMDRLIEISSRAGIELVLDNCDSLGSRWRGKFLSDYCIASSCSFYPAHHITTGQGGTVSSGDAELIELARSFAGWGGDCRCVGAANLLPNGSCGKRFSRWIPSYDGIVDHRYLFTNVGYNLRPLDLQGAVGIEQLRKFGEIHSRRRQTKERIGEAIERHLPHVRVLQEREGAETSWFGIGIVCSSGSAKEALVGYLERNLIQTRNYFAGNLLMHPAYEACGRMQDYPNSNLVMPQMFFIGCSPTITDEMVDYCIDTIKRFDGVNDAD